MQTSALTLSAPLALAILLALAACGIVLLIKLFVDHTIMRTQRRIWAQERAETERKARSEAIARIETAAAMRKAYRLDNPPLSAAQGVRHHPARSSSGMPTTASWVVPPESIHETDGMATGIGDINPTHSTPRTIAKGEAK